MVSVACDELLDEDESDRIEDEKGGEDHGDREDHTVGAASCGLEALVGLERGAQPFVLALHEDDEGHEGRDDGLGNHEDIFHRETI